MTSHTAPQPTYRDFLRVMSSGLAPDERLVIDIVNGDPGEHENMKRAKRKYMRPRTADEWATVELPDDRNLYLCVMAVKDGVTNRRGESFNGGIALMVDDVGDVNKARGIKVPKDIIGTLRPTALVETSEGNYQAWYRLTRPLRDHDLFKSLIDAFIREKLMGNDPGMGGVARIARIPYGINGKPSRNGWKVRLAELNEDMSYTPAELIRAFGLVINPPAPKPDITMVSTDQRSAEDFKYAWLKEHLESADPKNAQHERTRHEWKVKCPNYRNHTNGVFTGTTVFHPAKRQSGKYETQYLCYHGSCDIRTTNKVIMAILRDNPEAATAWRKFWDGRDDQIARDLAEVDRAAAGEQW